MSNRSQEVSDRRACANKISITEDVVDSANCGENLASSVDPGGREGCLFSGVAVLPLITNDVIKSMRSILDHIVVLVSLTFFDLLDLLSDAFESVNKSVHFDLVL